MAMVEDGGGFSYFKTETVQALPVITLPIAEYLIHVNKLAETYEALAKHRQEEIDRDTTEEALTALIESDKLAPAFHNLTRKVYFQYPKETRERVETSFFGLFKKKSNVTLSRHNWWEHDWNIENAGKFSDKWALYRAEEKAFDDAVEWQIGLNLPNFQNKVKYAQHLRRAFTIENSYNTEESEIPMEIPLLSLVDFLSIYSGDMLNIADFRNQFEAPAKAWRAPADKVLWQDKSSVTLPLHDYEAQSNLIVKAQSL